MKIQASDQVSDSSTGDQGTAPDTKTSKLRAIDARDFLQRVLKLREVLLTPWLFVSALVMIHAMRGVGKSLFAMSIAYALASGREVLGWRATRPVGVAYFDGELPETVLRERLEQAMASVGGEQVKPLLLVNLAFQDGDIGMPDLCTPEGQAAIDALLTDDIEVVVFDNLSTLCLQGKENEAESWTPVQQWALKHRAKGRTFIFVHHTGKNGGQRGTSRREDALDVVINLRAPHGHKASHGATFDVVFEKTRCLHGEAVDTFRAMYREEVPGQGKWIREMSTDERNEQIRLLGREGKSQAEIATELNVSIATVSRVLNPPSKAKTAATTRPQPHWQDRD